MKPRDDIAIANQRLWEEEVKKGCGYTVPWLDLDLSLLQRYIDGQIEILPEPLTCLYPASIFAGVAGKHCCAWRPAGDNSRQSSACSARASRSWI